MALSRLQARDRYILGSVIQFLDRNLKQDYDVEVATSATATNKAAQYATPIRIEIGKPDDITIVERAPIIAVAAMPSGEGKRFYELGSANVWRHRHYLLSCYPSLDGNKEPCDVAHQLLRSYVQDVFETECIKIVDYANSAAGNILFLNDVMYIDKVSDPIDRGQTSALAQERHRFDLHLSVKFVVAASLAT